MNEWGAGMKKTKKASVKCVDVLYGRRGIMSPINQNKIIK